MSMYCSESKYYCRLCQGTDYELLIDFGYRPITKRLLPSLQVVNEFVYPVSLYVCKQCSFVQILDVVPQDELYTNYSLYSAWKHQPHINDELSELHINNIIDENSFVIEIGCNDGILLNSLRQFGIDNLLGIEPSKDVAKIALSSGFDIINDYFSIERAYSILEKYGKADVIICRHVLEHISHLESFMQGIKAIVREGGFILMEVPDFSSSLEYGDVSTIWEEHVNYFTESTLFHLLSFYGFKVIYTKRYNFSGGSLCVVAKYTQERYQAIQPITREDINHIMKFPNKVEAFIDKVTQVLEQEKRNGGEVAVYGAGNRSVILLNYFLSDYVSFVVDDQTEKQNHYVPVCHLPILSSKTLLNHEVSLCLLGVNAENEERVINANKAFTERGGKFMSVLSPSKYLIT